MKNGERNIGRIVENVLLVAACVAAAYFSYTYAYSGELNTFLKSHGIYLIERQDEEAAIPPVEIEEEHIAEGLEAYSWEELSQISSELVAAHKSGENAMLEVARRYGLVDDSNRLTDDAKTIELADGTVFEVQVAGICHDWRPDRTEPLGLSFISTSAIAALPLRNDGSSAGGWAQSELRNWLDTEIASHLPNDLAAVIVPAVKRTNNVGRVESLGAVSTDLVSKTEDWLWIPSAVEVCGPLSWFSSEYGGNYARLDEVLNAEGQQYRRFWERGVNGSSDPEHCLVRNWDGQPAAWWYRSPYFFLSDDYYGVMPSGYPCTWNPASSQLGVVVGFCV